MVPLTKLFSALWTPSIPLANPSKLPSQGLHDSCSRGFHFLIRLAWESRYMIPVMYAVVSFLFDVQMRLEIIVVRERVAIHEEDDEEEEEDEGEGEGEEEGVDFELEIQRNDMPLPYDPHWHQIVEDAEESQDLSLLMRIQRHETEAGQIMEEDVDVDGNYNPILVHYPLPGPHNNQ